MGVWVRGLVLALVVLAGCAQENSTINKDMAVISIFNTGSGWGFQHSWVVYEDDTVREFSYSPNLDFGTFGLFDNGERRVRGMAPGAYKAIKALIVELDFANLGDLCGEESITFITDVGDTYIQIRENGNDTKAAAGCGNGDRETTPEYDAAWRAIARAIKEYVKQGAGTIVR